MSRGKRSNSFLQEAAVEIRIVGDDEDDPAQQIIDGAIVDALTGDHLVQAELGYSGFRTRTSSRVVVAA